MKSMPDIVEHIKIHTEQENDHQEKPGCSFRQSDVFIQQIQYCENQYDDTTINIYARLGIVDIDWFYQSKVPGKLYQFICKKFDLGWETSSCRLRQAKI